MPPPASHEDPHPPTPTPSSPSPRNVKRCGAGDETGHNKKAADREGRREGRGKGRSETKRERRGGFCMVYRRLAVAVLELRTNLHARTQPVQGTLAHTLSASPPCAQRDPIVAEAYRDSGYARPSTPLTCPDLLALALQHGGRSAPGPLNRADPAATAPLRCRAEAMAGLCEGHGRRRRVGFIGGERCAGRDRR